MSTDAEIGERIRDRRIEQRLSQTSLADGFVSPSYLSLLEAGKRHAGPDLLAELAQRLGTTADWLRTGDTEAALRQEVGLERAQLLLESGESGDALGVVEDLLSRTEISPRVRDEATVVQARALAALGRFEEMLAALLPLHERALGGAASVDVTRTGTVLVDGLLSAGDLHQGADVGHRAVEAAQAQSFAGTDPYLRLVATVMEAHFERGDLISAAQLAQDVLSETGGAQSGAAGRAAVHRAAALVAEEQGRLDLALHHIRQARSFVVDAPEVVAVRLRVAAAAMLLQVEPPQPDVAAAELDDAEALVRRTGSAQDLATWGAVRSRCALVAQDGDSAERYARVAVDAGADGLPQVRALLALADARLAVDDGPAALTVLADATAALGRVPGGRQVAQGWRDVGERLRLAGDVDAALDAFRRSLDSAGYRRSTSVDRVLDRA